MIHDLKQLQDDIMKEMVKSKIWFDQNKLFLILTKFMLFGNGTGYRGISIDGVGIEEFLK